MTSFPRPSALDAVPSRRLAAFLRAEHAPGRIAAWREAFLLGALIAAAFLPFDFLYADALAATLGAHGALVAILLACRAAMGPGRSRRVGPAVVTGATAAAFLAPVPVAAAAGGDGLRFGFLLVVPFILVSLLPEVPLVATGAGLVAAASGTQILLSANRPVAFVLEWVFLSVAVTLVTAWGSRRVRELASRADEADRDKDRAVSQLAESERRRALAERHAYVGRLAAGLGHELNNPLSAVKGNLLYAVEELQRTGAAAATREALEEALTAAERIAWLGADLRALAQDAEGPLIPCRVNEAVAQALALVRPRLGDAQVHLDLAPGLPAIRSEPRLLSAALGHLAARAATLGTGDHAVRIGARLAGAHVEIAVEDAGPPLPSGALHRLFDPAAPVDAGGGSALDVVLPLARELVERGGGRVSASGLEHGTRFTVTVPVAGPGGPGAQDGPPTGS